jgi:hypothetical protein
MNAPRSRGVTKEPDDVPKINETVQQEQKGPQYKHTHTPGEGENKRERERERERGKRK